MARPVMVLWASCVSQAARSIIWDKAILFVAQSGIETDGLTCRKLGVKGGKGGKDVWASSPSE